MLNLLKYNRHWHEGFRYQYTKKRKLFETLKLHIANRQIIELVGLRRTGKSTLLFQLINFLLNENTAPHNVWYFSFDEEQCSLDELFVEFQKQTKKDINQDKLFVFLDEIQKLENFQSSLKVYYDLYPNIKIFISGSTSLFIKKKTQESLTGRLFSVTLHPLDFDEYLDFVDKSTMLQLPEMYHKELEMEYERYVSHQFVETLFIENTDLKKEYLTGILRKIIFEDIPTTFSVNNPEILYAIIKIVAQKPRMYLHYDHLANDLNISSKTVSKYISILEQAFLLKILYNYSTNQLTSEKKLKRLYLASSSFCVALFDFTNLGSLIENAIIATKPYNFFWRDAYKHEVDFVKIENNRCIPIEVKYRKQVKRTDYQNIYLFTKKFKTDKAILITKQHSDNHIIHNDFRIDTKSLYFW